MNSSYSIPEAILHTHNIQSLQKKAEEIRSTYRRLPKKQRAISERFIELAENNNWSEFIKLHSHEFEGSTKNLGKAADALPDWADEEFTMGFNQHGPFLNWLLTKTGVNGSSIYEASNQLLSETIIIGRNEELVELVIKLVWIMIICIFLVVITISIIFLPIRDYIQLLLPIVKSPFTYFVFTAIVYLFNTCGGFYLVTKSPPLYRVLNGAITLIYPAKYDQFIGESVVVAILNCFMVVCFLALSMKISKKASKLLPSFMTEDDKEQKVKVKEKEKASNKKQDDTKQLPTSPSIEFVDDPVIVLVLIISILFMFIVYMASIKSHGYRFGLAEYL